MTLERALLIALIALGFARLERIPVELLFQGLAEFWPAALDWMIILAQDGSIHGDHSVAFSNLAKDNASALVGIGLCIYLRRNIPLLPQFSFLMFKNVVLSLGAGAAVGLAVRYGIDQFASGQSLSSSRWFALMTELGPKPASTALILVCVLAPFEEEFIHRGVIVERAGPAKTWQLAAITILPWALVHVTIGGLWQVASVLLLGPVCFWLRLKTGHFGYSAIAHAVFNAIQIWP